MKIRTLTLIIVALAVLDGTEALTSEVDADGDVWHTDEYGDMSYMWDYK